MITKESQDKINSLCDKYKLKYSLSNYYLNISFGSYITLYTYENDNVYTSKIGWGSIGSVPLDTAIEFRNNLNSAIIICEKINKIFSEQNKG